MLLNSIFIRSDLVGMPRSTTFAPDETGRKPIRPGLKTTAGRIGRNTEADLFPENEIDGQHQTDEAGQVVPTQLVRFHEDQHEKREDDQRDHLLDHLQLP